MGTISKVLIAYDGLECSDAALDDLKRAGLPEVLQAIVVTVTDVVLPAPIDQNDGDSAPTNHIREVEHYARDHAEKVINAARRTAERGARRLRTDFPKWDIQAEVHCEAPAWSLVKIGYRDHPGLIVVGSHRLFVAGGRLILGSISQRVLYEARCSVRVARCSDRRQGPVRIAVGFNGTSHADAAVDAVAARAWPDGTEVRVISAREPADSIRLSAALERLRAAGLTASHTFKSGNPAHLLLREAEEWDADSIFLGTNDVHGYQHLLHGSIAATVAARAQCSVEIVRPEVAPNQLAA
jgi:nucleotide-binding universal stress UspA family protein